MSISRHKTIRHNPFYKLFQLTEVPLPYDITYIILLKLNEMKHNHFHSKCMDELIRFSPYITKHKPKRNHPIVNKAIKYNHITLFPCNGIFIYLREDLRSHHNYYEYVWVTDENMERTIGKLNTDSGCPEKIKMNYELKHYIKKGGYTRNRYKIIIKLLKELKSYL